MNHCNYACRIVLTPLQWHANTLCMLSINVMAHIWTANTTDRPCKTIWSNANSNGTFGICNAANVWSGWGDICWDICGDGACINWGDETSWGEPALSDCCCCCCNCCWNNCRCFNCCCCCCIRTWCSQNPLTGQFTSTRDSCFGLIPPLANELLAHTKETTTNADWYS